MRMTHGLSALALVAAISNASAQGLQLSADEVAVLRPVVVLSQDVRRLLADGKVEEAHRRVEAEIREVESAREANPDDWRPAARLAWALEEQIHLTLRTRDLPEATEICDEILARQDALAREFPRAALVLGPVTTSHSIAFRYHRSRSPDRAERFLDSFRAAIDAIPTDDAQLRELFEHREGIYERHRAELARTRHHRSLLGEPAPALPQQGTWINGTPLSEDDLKGKVVLLDFWGVYCVPCIAAFPELRRWQEEYADRGLVIIGVTGLFGYDWDEGARQAVQVDDLSEGDELRALGRFAAHHGLNYRIFVEPEGYPLIESYRVGAIPHSVLIDREGKVRLVVTGGDEEDLRAVEKMIIDTIE